MSVRSLPAGRWSSAQAAAAQMWSHGHSKVSSPCVTSFPCVGARRCRRAPPCPQDGFGYPTLEPGLLKPLSPGHPAPKSPSWPCLRAGGVRREQAVASTQGASSGVGTAAACPFSRHFCGLSSHSLLPWFLSIHCGLRSSSPPVSVLLLLSLSLSLSGRVSLRLTPCLPAASSGSSPPLAPAAGHQLFSAPFASTFPALPPPLPSSCPA